jgi:excinuclease ABC subunit B
MSADQLKKSIAESRKKMEKSAKEMDYPAAAKFRDEMLALQKLMDEKYGVK